MASFYRSNVGEFLTQTNDYVLARLSVAYANRGYTSQYSDQTLTWERDVHWLRSVLEQCVSASESAASWEMLLEFSIPRKELRIDAILLVRDVVVLLEAKTSHAAQQAKRQVEEYALLLHYFHKGSANRRIVPVLVSPEAVSLNVANANLAALRQREFFPQLPTYWVTEVLQSSWGDLQTY